MHRSGVESLYLQAFTHRDSLAMLCTKSGEIVALTQALKQQLGLGCEQLIGDILSIELPNLAHHQHWTDVLSKSHIEHQIVATLSVKSGFNFQSFDAVTVKALRSNDELIGFTINLGRSSQYPAILPKSAWLKLFDESPEGIALINESMEILSSNRAFLKLTHADSVSVVGRSIDTLINVAGGFKHWFINSPKLTVAGTITNDQHTKSVQLSITPFEIGHKLLFWCFIYDLSNQSNSSPKHSQTLQRIYKLFNDNRDGVAFSSSTGIFVEVNKRFADILGRTPEQIIGKHISDFNEDNSFDLSAEAEKAFIATGYAEPFEKTLVTGSGTAVNVEIQLIAHYGNDGKFQGSWSVTKPISGQNPATKRIQYRYESLFEQALDAIAYAKIDGRIELVNSAFCKLLGRTKEQIIGRDYTEFTAPDDVSREQHYYKDQLLSRGYTDIYDKKFVLPDGELVPVSIRGVLTKTQEGEPEGVWSISRDNKLRDRLIESLADSEHRFRSLFSSSFDAIGLWSTDDRLQYANKAYLELIGYSQEELRNLNYRDFTPEGNEEVDAMIAEQVLTQGHSDIMEKVIRHKSGRLIPVSIRASGMTDGQGNLLGSWVILRDISDYRNALKRLEHSQNLLRQTSRMSRVGGWELYLDTNHFKLTDEAYRILSLPTAYQMTVKSIAKLLEPDSERSVFRSIHKALLTETHQETELKLSGFEPERWVKVSAQVGYESDGKKYLYGAIQDITDFKSKEKTLELVKNTYQHLAFHDPLTKLPNRLLLDDRFIQSTSQARRENTIVALLIIDLDDFKMINDHYGHPAGDALLKELAQRLSNSVRAHDTVARLGGDEFVVIARIDNKDQIPILAGKITEQVSQPVFWKKNRLNTSCSIGVATYPEQGDSFDRLYKSADKALYRRKSTGKDGFEIA